MTAFVDNRPGIFSRIIKFLGPRGVITWLLSLTLLSTIAGSMTSNIAGLQMSFVIDTNEFSRLVP